MVGDFENNTRIEPNDKNDFEREIFRPNFSDFNLSIRRCSKKIDEWLVTKRIWGKRDSLTMKMI